MAGSAISGLRRAALTLALVYAFLTQGLLAPLAALRMEAMAAVSGVLCVTSADGASIDGAAMAPHCDVSCLLRGASSAAPPPSHYPLFAPARRFATLAPIPAPVAAAPALHGLRPQSQRAPPFA